MADRIFHCSIHELSSCGVQACLLHGVGNLSSPTGDGTDVPSIAGQILNHWTTKEVPTY